MDKDTAKFSRESFKEKILRELEESSSPFARPNAMEDLEALESEKNIDKPERKEAYLKLEPFKLPESEFPEEDDFSPQEPEQAIPEAVEHEEVPQETGTLRERLEAIALEQAKLQEQQASGQYSRSRAHRQSEDSADGEPIIGSRSKERAHQAKRTPSKQSQPKSKKEKPKKKKKATASKIIAVIVLLLILVAGGTGWYGYNYIKAGVQPLNTADHTIKAVNIPVGASSKQIGSILQKNGIIKNGMIFQYYTKFKNYTGFKSGYYNLSPDMALDTVATTLEKGGTPKPVAPVLGKVTIPEGWTLDQIAKGITVNADEKNGKTPFTTEEFMKVVQDPTFIEKMKQKYPELFASLPSKDSGVKYQLEGYLFPATYDYTKSSTTETMVASMIEAMNTQLAPYYGQIATQNMSVNEVLSMAALVEKEANNDADRREVAGVFYNRMKAGMTLDSNSSVLYAEGKLGADTTLKQDATIDTSLASPYNLYANQGTGPGPIDSPSLSSIKAVLAPTQSNYYYFVADVTTGKVYFAQTLAEQNQNVQTYVNDKLSK